MPPVPDEVSDPDAALRSAWSAVESGDLSRIAAAVAELPTLIPVVVAEDGEGSTAHRSALRALAYGLDELGERAASREMYGMLAELLADLQSGAAADPESEDVATDWAAFDDERDVELDEIEFVLESDGEHPGRTSRAAMLLEEELYARALAALIGATATQEQEALSVLDGLVARSEVALGPAHRRTLWLLSRRAQWMVRVNGAPGLAGFELLIARAASIAEGGPEHLAALADQATELSRLDLDDESALIWERVTAGRRNIYGLEHSETLAAWWWLVRTLTWSGDIAGADRELSQLIPALRRLLGDDDGETITALRFRVQLLRQLRADGVASASGDDPLALVREILTLETARFGPDSSEVFRTRDVAIEIGREQWEPGADHSALMAEARTLVLDATSEWGAFGEAAIHARHTEQRLLRTLRDGLQSGAPETETVIALGRAHAIEWREQISQHCRDLVAADPADDADVRDAFLDELRGAWQAEAEWDRPGSDARVSAWRSGASDLADLGAPARPAEIRLRDVLARELFAAERAEESLAEYERVLLLERARAEDPDPPADLAVRIALSVQAVGSAMRRVGHTERAERLLAEGIREAREQGVSEEVLRDLRNARALALQELDRTDEAVAEMRALVDASTDVGYAIDLAVVYLNGDRPLDAETVLRPALARLEESGQGASVQAMRIMGNLALAACKLDRDEDAAAAYDRLHELQIASIGPTHRDTLITLNNRALEEQHLGRFVEAVRRFEQVHEMRVRALGERDPQTLSSLANLAQSAQSAGDLETSRRHAERAVALSREVLGPTHPSTLSRVRVLDHTLELLGATPAERAELASTVTAGFASATDADDGSAHAGLTALRYADHLTEQARYVDALVEFTRARDAFSTEAGLNWLRAERGIAASHLALQAFQEASESYARVVPQLERLLPDDRWALADALNLLSLSHSRAQHAASIEAPQRRAIEIADAEGSRPERAVLFRVWLGRRLAANDEHEAALEVYQDAVDAGEAQLGADHRVTVDARDDVAEELVALGRGREALQVYRRNLPALVRAFGADSPQVTRARERQRAAAQGRSRVRSGWVLGVVAAGVIALVLWNTFGG